MDRATLRKVADIVERASTAALEAEGFTARYTGGNFDDRTGMLKLEVVPVAKDGESGATREGAMLERMGGTVGTTFVRAGRQYRILGYVPSRRKYPISAERLPDGKRFKFGREVLDAAA